MSNENNGNDIFRKTYDPSNCSPITRFRMFNYDEYPCNSQTNSLLRSIELRFEKIHILWEHYNALASVQPKEKEILKRDRYVYPKYSYLMTAIFEAILNEFYSINDNLAKILANIFPNKNLPNKMSKLIKNVEKCALPVQLSNIIINYNSYQSLRNVRTELAHFSTGFVVVNDMIMSYFSDKVGPTTTANNNAILIDNVVKFYNTQFTETTQFITQVFDYLESTLNNNYRSVKFCGIYKGFFYQRQESYADWKTNVEGICTPIWETNNQADKCPHMESCKAYNNHLREKNKIA